MALVCAHLTAAWYLWYLWWLEEQQMLRCDGDVPADESGELCQHSVYGCTDGAEMTVLV